MIDGEGKQTAQLITRLFTVQKDKETFTSRVRLLHDDDFLLLLRLIACNCSEAARKALIPNLQGNKVVSLSNGIR